MYQLLQNVKVGGRMRKAGELVDDCFVNAGHLPFVLKVSDDDGAKDNLHPQTNPALPHPDEFKLAQPETSGEAGQESQAAEHDEEGDDDEHDHDGEDGAEKPKKRGGKKKKSEQEASE